MSQENTRARFESIANSAEEDIRIDEAALVIAAETDQNVNIIGSLEKLDQLANQFETAKAEDTVFGISVARLIDFIHQEAGFSGNVKSSSGT